MAERNLIARLGGDLGSINLAKPVDSLLLLSSLFLYRKNTEVYSLAVIVIFIDFQNIQVEGDCKLALWLRAYKEVSDNLRRIDGKNIIKVCNFSAGRGDLSSHSLQPYKVISHGYRSFPSEYLDYTLGCIVASAFCKMVLSTWLEVYAFLDPSPRPVYTPWELCIWSSADIDGLCLIKLIIVVCHTPFPIPTQDCGVITVSEGGEYGNRPPVSRKRLCPVLIEHFPYLVPMLKGCPDVRSILVGSISFSLIKVFRINTNGRKNLLHVDFIASGIVFSPTLGIRNKSNRLSEVCLQQLLLRHILRNLSKYIVVIPRIDEPYVLSSFPKTSNHQFHCDDFPEVSNMHGTGRCNTAGTCIEFLLTLFTDDLICHYIRPMGILIYLFAHTKYYVRVKPLYATLTHKCGFFLSTKI